MRRVAHHLPGIRRTYVHDGRSPPGACAVLPLLVPLQPSIDAPELPERIARLSCASCGATLSHRHLAVRQMPGRDWLELAAEAWSCHRGEFAGMAGRISCAASDASVVLGGRGLLFQRGACIVAHKDDVGDETCPACSAQLAHASLGATLGLNTHVALMTGRVLFHPLEGDSPYGRAQCADALVLRLVAREIVDVVHSHGSTLFSTPAHVFSLVSASTAVAFDDERPAPALVLRIGGSASAACSLAALLPRDHVSLFDAAVAEGASLAARLGLSSCALVPLPHFDL